MARVGYSTVFDALTACHQRLQGLTFPTLAASGDAPDVVFMEGRDNPTEREFVELVGVVNDHESNNEDGGQARNQESFLLHIRVGTEVEGRTGADVVARLRELSEVIQGEFRDQSNGRPKPLDLDGRELLLGVGVERIEVQPWPTSQGWAGFSDHYLRVYARI